MTTTAAPAKRDWLAMIFMGADNDLFQFGNTLLAEAQRVGSTPRVAIVAERDPTDPAQPTTRGEVLRGRWQSRPIGRTPGDAKTVIDFVEDAKAKFPAEKKLLILWDHGNGWQNVHAFQRVVSVPDALRIDEITEAVKQAEVNVVCFDACLMSMIEIAYQLREHVQFMVASENVVPADSGWPYDTILGKMATRPEMGPEELVRAMVDCFSGSYNGSDDPVTLSGLNLAYVTNTVKAIDALSRELIAACMNGSRQQVLFARRYAQSFGNPDYIDIVSFCLELERLLPGTPICNAAAVVREWVGKLVINCTRGSAASISGAHGVSIYFPDRPMSSLYQRLEFADPQTCMWASFLGLVTPRITSPRRLKLPAAPGDSAHSCPRGHTVLCPECEAAVAAPGQSRKGRARRVLPRRKRH